MKIAYVTPRYGEEIVGGAEHAARMLAERLVSQLGWRVEAITSCATDGGTWANTLPSGDTVVNGVKVRRFATTQERGDDFLDLSWKVHRNPALALPADERRWIDSQGPLTPDLLQAVADCDADAVAFYPYLYYPTVYGIDRVGQRAVLHPAAHDEAVIRMPIYAKTFARAAGFVFQTDGERTLVEHLFPIADRPQLLLGLGVEPVEADAKTFREKYNLGDSPYLLCVGRVDGGKGSFLLQRYFTQYKKQHPSPLKLVFIGPVMQQLPKSDDVVVTGIVSDEDKWSALRGCATLVSPSAFEAFSLALIEGWTAGRPTLVNAACLATREHVERSGGGLWFDSYLSFAAAVDRLLWDEKLASKLAQAGYAYVDARFRWSSLIERYGTFLRQVAERAQSARRKAS